jgi:hypothetical protein
MLKLKKRNFHLKKHQNEEKVVVYPSPEKAILIGYSAGDKMCYKTPYSPIEKKPSVEVTT